MLKLAFNALLGLLLLGAIGIALVAWYVIPDLPGIEQLNDAELQVPLRVYSHDGSLISQFGEKRRDPIEIADVPPLFVQAFLAAEDDRFFAHPGVDWQGILRAVIELIRTGEKTQGGSTITMQVARNFFLTREKTYLRKINEIFLALKIERELTKPQILELYLNKIYLGQRAFGISAAAQVYYGKQPDELTLAQMAMIAGLPKAPSTTNPITSQERARGRRAYVLNRMKDLGYINSSEYTAAMNAPIEVELHSFDAELQAPYVAEMVRKYMVETYGEEQAYSGGYRVYTTIRDELQTAANAALRGTLIEYDHRHGYRGPEHHYDLTANSSEQDWRELLSNFSAVNDLLPALVTGVNEKSLQIYIKDIGAATIGWDGLVWAQPYKTENWRGPEPKQAADVAAIGDVIRVVAEYAPADSEAAAEKATDETEQESTEAAADPSATIPPERTVTAWRLSQLPLVEGALISLDPNSGATLALVGGFSFELSKFNRVTQARRQPGSGFKPYIYSAALAKGFTPASVINDAPIMFADTSIDDQWRPQNYSGKSYGPTRLREALVHSRNLVSIRLMHAVGIPFVMDHLKRFGFDIEKLPATLSLALGTGAISPYEQARGYSVFANGGFLIQPYFIERIERSDEGIIFEADPLLACYPCEDVVAGDESTTTATGNENGIEPSTDAEPTPAPSDPSRYAPRTLSAENAWLITSMTQDVVRRGTGVRAYRALGRDDLSGKTGTTDEQRDAWFSGFNRDIVTVVWVGFDKFTPLGKSETGSHAALPMWIDYMSVALAGTEEHSMARPDGLVNARIDPETGKLARADDPDAIFEVFQAGNVPTEYSRETGADSYRNYGYSEPLF